MQLTLRVPDEQMSIIKNIAEKMGLKKSDVTRMAIKKFIEEYSYDEEKPYKKIKHLLGIAESGFPDLGQRHRNYLLKKIQGSGDK